MGLVVAVLDEGGGQGQLCQIIWWMLVMGAVLGVTGGEVLDLAL